MFRMTRSACQVCAAVLAGAIPFAATAAAPASPPPSKPYPFVVQNDVTRAYQYRTRILSGNPACQNFASASDAAFLDDKLSDEAKVALLRKIGAEAEASGCLGP